MKVRKDKAVLLIPALVVFDQLTKALALLFLTTVCNTGSAFSLPFSSLFLTTIIIGVLAFVFARSSKGDYNLPLALILGGGISNLVDRIFHGCVVDFIDLPLLLSFNIADSAITAGVALLFVTLFFNKQKI